MSMNWNELENGWKDWQADARLRWRRLSDQQVAIAKGNEQWMHASVGVMTRAATALAAKP
jgi:hypothetical protein